MSESRRVGRVEKGVAEGSIEGVRGDGAVGIGFIVVVEEAAELAALTAYDEAVVPQIELVAVEPFGTDFAPHIGLQAEKSGKRGRGGQPVFGRTFRGLFVTLGDNGLKGVVGGLQVIFAAFGFAVGSSGVGELLEIEYAAERVKAAYIGTELMMLPFGQAGMGKGFEVAEGHIGAFRRRRGRHQLNVKKPERYCTVPVFNEAHKLFTQTQTGNQFAVGVGFGAAQVAQQAAACADHFQQAATAVVVFRVGFEVRGQVVYAEGQQCYLYFRRTGIAFFALEIFNDLCFLFYGQCHN